MVHTDSTTPSDVRPQAPVGDTPGTSDRGQTPQPAHKYRFPTLIDLLALVGIWYLLQFVGLLAARLAGFDFPDWDLLRGNVAPTPEQQDALARFTAFTYLVTMGLMILFTLFYRRLRHGTRKTLRFSARGLNPVLLLWGLVMMLAAGIVIEPVVELLPMPSSAVYGRGVLGDHYAGGYGSSVGGVPLSGHHSRVGAGQVRRRSGFVPLVGVLRRVARTSGAGGQCFRDGPDPGFHLHRDQFDLFGRSAPCHEQRRGFPVDYGRTGRGHDTFGYRQRYTLYDRLRRCARAFRRIGLYDLPFAGPGEKVG